MPDPISILEAIGTALATAAILVACFGWPNRKSGTAALDFGWVLGTGAGFLLGCVVLSKIPHWPPSGDQDRLLLVVLPAVVIVELLATFPRIPLWIIWPLRVALAAGVAPVLLHGTVYLTGEPGPESLTWSTAQAYLILGGLAASLVAAWLLLGQLSARVPRVSTAVCLAMASAGAGLAIMISGYMSGGQAGLALSGAVSGAALATRALGWSSRGARPLGVALVGFYSLIVIGRFFGELSTTHAILLFGSPLLAWLPEFPLVRRLPRWARELTRVLLVGLVVSAIVVIEVRKFTENTPVGADSEYEDAAAQN